MNEISRSEKEVFNREAIACAQHESLVQSEHREKRTKNENSV